MSVQSSSPRAAKTRSALMRAGLDLLAARPVDAIPIDEFVAVAGVSKGSFFNHFADKQAFAAAIANDIRAEIEGRVEAWNAGVADPINRLVNGLLVAAAYAIEEPKRTGVLARAALGMSAIDHPLNRGVFADVQAAVSEGMFRPEAERVGVLIWLSCCQSVMATLAEQSPDTAAADLVVRDVVLVGLTGLGVGADRLSQVFGELPPLHRLLSMHQKEFP